MLSSVGKWVSAIGYTRDDIMAQNNDKYHEFSENYCDICQEEILNVHFNNLTGGHNV